MWVVKQMMHDILGLQDRISIALQLGESHFREFKTALEGAVGAKRPRDFKAICTDIAQTLVAFANADGGELLIGVEDDGSVSGVNAKEELIAGLLAAPKTHIHKDTPLPVPHSARVEYEGKLILYFSIPKGTRFVYLTADGRCLQRKDRESVPISTEAISFSRSEVVSREYDRQYVENAQISDLDASLVMMVSEHVSKGMSIEKCLQHLELVDFDGSRFRVRRAALLLFAREPHRWHPRLQVRVLKINGTEIKTGEQYNVIADQETTNNILNLVESSWDLLRPHLTETRFSKDALFRAQIMYPELACREALVNSIAHRDYSIEGRGIEVRVYTDRLEIVSPGGLLSAISLSDLRELKGVHQSRNSLVSRVLREIGYMRELGEGIRRMFELMKSNDLTPPEISSDNNVFSMTLHHRYVYTPEQKLWLGSFDKFNLSREQKTIVLLGYNNHIISPREIWEAVGIVDTEYYRQLIVSLQELGILESAINKISAQNMAKKRKTSVKHIPRFSISLPKISEQSSPPVTEISPPRPLTSPLSRRPAPVRHRPVPPNAPSQPVVQPDAGDYARVYVGNVPYNATSSELSDALTQFGPIEDVTVPTDFATGRPRGYAFAEFENSADAGKAVKSGKMVFQGRTLYLNEATPPRRR
jgi:ATP-dependent DNA helicase RecG